jgi:hypothetical protein
VVPAVDVGVYTILLFSMLAPILDDGLQNIPAIVNSFRFFSLLTHVHQQYTARGCNDKFLFTFLQLLIAFENEFE